MDKKYQEMCDKGEEPSVQGYGSSTLNGANPTPTYTRRRTALDALRDLIGAVRVKALRLEALERSLPQELPFNADEELRLVFEQEFARFHRF